MEKRARWLRSRSIRSYLGPAAFTVLLALAGCASTSHSTAAERPATPAATPDAQLFADFIRDFRTEAIAAGIKPETYDKATVGIHINDRVKTLNENQPEFTRPVWDYLSGAVSDLRVTQGKEVLADNASLFRSLQRKYGVPKEVIAAVWGLESGYGRNTGSFNIFEALATLAYHGPRMAFGREQLIAAMKIMQQEKLEPSQMTSSWAGAIGHTQFVPTTFLLHAVDGDGDGVRNLWQAEDALASAANYLKASGWKTGDRWGIEVRLPEGFAYEDCDVDIQKPMSEWAARGVKTATGDPLTPSDEMAAIFLPAGHKGPAFLVRQNFRVILVYNAATSYALAISLLSERLKGGGEIIANWPRSELSLTKDQRLALQEGLAALGFDVGTPDGVVGRKTRAAVRAYQKARNLPADGFATRDLVTRIGKERAGDGS